MATGPGFASSTNTFVPNLEASGRLAMAFSRNPKTFPVMRWAQLVQSPKNVGLYLKMNAQEAARVVSDNDNAWGRGSARPDGAEGLESFNFFEFRTQRYDYPFSLDEDAASQAEWAIVEQHAAIHAAKAMTARAMRAISVLTTAANFQTSADPDISTNHTATATALSGGQLNLGTSTAPYIKISLDKIANLINLDTLGVVTSEMLEVIINPNQARLWAESAEIHDYIKGSPAAMDEIRTGSSPNARYGPGLPSTIYGYKIHVDNTVKVTSRKGASSLTKALAFPDQTMAVVARVGALEAPFGGPSFSTLTIFWYRDEMTLERFDDTKNRRIEAHVVVDEVPVLTSPLSGYLLTSTTSVAS